MVLCLLAAAAGFASGTQEDESFSYPGIERVEVRADFLDLEVRAELGSSASLRADLPEDTFFEQRHYAVKHELDGSTLKIWVDKEFVLLGPRRGGTLFLRVPQEAELSAETSSGNLRVDGSATRTVRAHTVSGELFLTDIEAGVEAVSVSGSIEARRIRGDASFSTVSGGLDLRDIRGTCTARTVSGRIEGRGILLENEGFFKTVSGDIMVNLRNPLDEVRYDLSTVSGDLTVGTVRASRGLRMGTGPCLLRGETISGSQTYR